jgi:DNA-binding MarR family transcriptional regulator
MSSACDFIACDVCSNTMKDRQHDHSTSIPLDLEIFLCFAVYSAGHAFNRVYKPMLEKLRLTYPQYIAMVLLWERDGQTVGELGRKLLLESNTLTPLLKRLETLGNVKRQRDPLDERQVRVNLTDAGRKLRQRASHIPR